MLTVAVILTTTIKFSKNFWCFARPSWMVTEEEILFATIKQVLEVQRARINVRLPTVGWSDGRAVPRVSAD